jgi:hypothetical protein
VTAVEHDYWATVPTIDDEPETGFGAAAAAATGDGTPRKATTSRRTALKAAGALGGGLALTVLSWLPPARSKPAAAAVGTEYANSCAGYDGWAGYNDNSKVCVGATYGSGYCGGDGWYLNYFSATVRYWPIVLCGIDNGLAARNAWRWTHGGTRYRCADGVFWTPGGGEVLRICARANP